MARGKHSGESRIFGDDNYNRRSRRVEDYNSYEEEPEEFEDNNYEEDYDDYEDEKRINFKKIFIIILVIFLIIEIIFGVRKFLAAKKGTTEENLSSTESTNMVADIEGYSVLGKIKIDKIGVEQFILNSTEDKALQNGVCKLYGGQLNALGNFCIAGHDFDNVFAKLSELEIGDTFIIIDKNNKETKYEIKDSYSVEPDNLEPLLQNESKVEITLITCENGSTKRLVVKAEEVKN